MMPASFSVHRCTFRQLVFFFLFCWAGAVVPLAGAAQQGEAAVILQRHKVFLFRTDTSGRALERLPLPGAQGRWSDIDYANDAPGAWLVSAHMGRIKVLALAWAQEGGPHYHSPVLKKSMDAALGDWFRHRYQSKNWWHNEIGVPQMMRDIMVLLRDSLSGEQFRQSLSILGQHRVKGTGANLVWSADLGLHYGAFTGNTQLMQQCRDRLVAEIKVTTEEGVQPDYSFHQHGKRLQMYHYGGAFLKDNLRLAWQLRGLSLAFPEEKITILADFALQGWQWMSRGIHTVPGTIDRAASREHALHSADIRPLFPLFYELLPGKKEAIAQMQAAQEGRYTLEGYRHYPYSDFTVYHQPGYSFFLKSISSRTLLTESINHENLKGELLNNGDAYWISDGTEYYDLMPFWDWNRLPGMTTFAGERKNKIRPQTLVGGAGSGSAGLSVMAFAQQKDGQSLEGIKFWASWKDLTVVLLGGLRADQLDAPPYTVLDQSRWQDKITVSRGRRLKEGRTAFASLRWIHHHRFVYLPLVADSVVIEAREVTGTWAAINKSESVQERKAPVFLPTLVHRGDASGYVVGYAPSLRRARAIARRPAWRILRNDSTGQAVLFADGTLMAGVYRPGTTIETAGGELAVNTPCLLVKEGSRLFASDPRHTGAQLAVRWNGVLYEALLPADGQTVEVFPAGTAAQERVK